MKDGLQLNSGAGRQQNMMVFILSMTIFGLSDLITEMIPDIEIGPIDIGIPYFAFAALIFVFLLEPFPAALGAAVGEMILGDLLMGDFSGLGEFESFLEFFIAMYIAGLILRNPLDRKQVIFAAIVGVGIDQLLSSIVDLGRLWIGVKEFTAVPGLPESALFLEAIEFLNQTFVSGVLFGILPLLYLIPRLHGKIEPLLGMKPRSPANPPKGRLDMKLIIICVILFALAASFKFVSDII